MTFNFFFFKKNNFYDFYERSKIDTLDLKKDSFLAILIKRARTPAVKITPQTMVLITDKILTLMGDRAF